jgi:hypothetical protein
MNFKINKVTGTKMKTIVERKKIRSQIETFENFGGVMAS